MDSRKHVSLWEMMVWAYGVQRVHAFLPAWDGAWNEVRNKWRWLQFLLATTDNDPEAPRPAVHVDAAAVHATVLEMDEDDALVIISVAQDGVPPGVCVTQPRPYPVDAERSCGKVDGQRWGWHVVDGRRVDYLIRVAEEIPKRKALYEMSGRRKVRITGYEVIREPVEFCPIKWDPDPSFLEFSSGLFTRWKDAMGRLMGALDGVSFREHIISGIGVDGDAPKIDEPLFHDARAAGIAMEVGPTARYESSNHTRSTVYQSETGEVGEEVHHWRGRTHLMR